MEKCPTNPGIGKEKFPCSHAWISKTVVLDSSSQFRPGPPPDYAKEMAELKSFKQTFRSMTNAFFWASQDFWGEQLNKKIFEYNLNRILRGLPEYMPLQLLDFMMVLLPAGMPNMRTGVSVRINMIPTSSRTAEHSSFPRISIRSCNDQCSDGRLLFLFFSCRQRLISAKSDRCCGIPLPGRHPFPHRQ